MKKTYQKKLKEKRYLDRKAEKLKQEGTNFAIEILQIIPVYVLCRKFGFGNVRAERFIHEYWRLTEKVAKDKNLLSTIVSDIEMSVGLKFDGELINLWNPTGEKKRCVRRPKK